MSAGLEGLRYGISFASSHAGSHSGIGFAEVQAHEDGRNYNHGVILFTVCMCMCIGMYNICKCIHLCGCSCGSIAIMQFLPYSIITIMYKCMYA